MVARPSPEDFKQLVRAKTDIVRLISESITLTAIGRNYQGLCPHHDCQRPCLTVNSVRQTYQCQVCGVAGDCFSFVMSQLSVNFDTALKRLALQAGLKMLPPELGNFE
jgi:DNA primase